MSLYLALGVLLFVLPWNLYWLVVRPARKQRRVVAAEPRLPEGFVPPSAALAPPEPRAPRDTSRTYPRPGRTRSKLTRVCPVCGMEDPGNLDGKVLGWPAHHSCAEWLGGWRPQRYVPPPPRRPAGSVTAVAVSASPGAQVNVGSGNKQDGSFPITSVGDVTRAQEMLKNGLASVNEVRERLNREIIASWGVPPAILGEHTHKAGDPLPIERCPKCGAQFCGTPDYLRTAYKLHLQLGCRRT